MSRSRRMGTAILILSVTLSALWGYVLRRELHGGIGMVDFGAIYYGSRCALQHKDPYDPGTVLREFEADGGRFPGESYAAEAAQAALINGINLPTALFLAAPLALLPWGMAQILWIFFNALPLVLAAYLLWDLGANRVPILWLCLAGFILANCQNLFFLGDAAGIAVGLCIIAACCFLRERHALAGVLLMAISLLLKPHDGGFIWLYFLLSGGMLRKRALQTFAVVSILGFFAIVWMGQVSPRWMHELHRNIRSELVHGGLNDPAPSATNSGVDRIIDLQAAISVFRNNPEVYNPVSYLIAGPLILIWAFVVMKRRFSSEQAPLALAAISVLTLLPVYHRPYDAKLLLLTIPACAMLWAEGGMRRWVALALTSAGILVTSDLPLVWLLIFTKNLTASLATWTGKLMNVLLWPAPLVLLALGCFYLWVFIRRVFPLSGSTLHQHAAQ